MKGNNELRFNHATMVEAIQMYVDSIMKEHASPKVLSVQLEGSTFGDPQFIVSVTDKEATQS